MPTPTLLAISAERYEAPLAEIVHEMSRTTHLVFVYEDNLQGLIEPPPWYYEGLDEEERRERLRESLEQHGLRAHPDLDEMIAHAVQQSRLPTRQGWLEENADLVERTRRVLTDVLGARLELVPFRQRNEVTVRLFEALDDIAGGVFLRLYVPRGRYQEEQLKQFLELFARYFREAEGREFSIDTHETRRGVTYVFKERGTPGELTDLHAGLRRFDDFMLAAQVNPTAAEAVRQQHGAERAQAQSVIAKYMPTYRRVLLDAKHELEQRKLALSQQMEADLLEVDQAPAIASIADGRPSALFSIVGNSAPVTIQMPTTALQLGPHARAYVDGLVNGTAVYSAEDQQIQQLIGDHAGEDATVRLRSDLDRASDDAVPRHERTTAVQRLKSFLYKVGSSAGTQLTDAGVKALVAYLERKLTGAG